MEKFTHKSFFFSFFFCNKRKLKEKQRENKAGQNVVSFTCKYLFQRKEFTMKAYSKLFFFKKGEFCSKRQLSSCLKLFYDPCITHCITLLSSNYY